MFENMFVVGITGPTSLVVIAIIALIIFWTYKITTIWKSCWFNVKRI